MPPAKTASASPTPLGVYVHFPYCLKKCPYCDFLSIAVDRSTILHQPYADRVVTELKVRQPELAGLSPSTVFFGGGTPSLWEPDALGGVLAAIKDTLGAEQLREVTVECNPSSFDESRARALVFWGVNRVSIGVQSLNDERLAFLGRLHGPEQGLEAVRAALRVPELRVSADLIFGVQGQSPEEAASEARRVAELGLTHISAYALTIEPGTRFGELARNRRLPLLSDDRVAESFVAVHEALGEYGFEHYEISNFAREGQRAQHNLGYWLGHPYLGLGCGAWGTYPRNGERVRYRNTQSLERYLSLDNGTASPTALETTESIDSETYLRECLMLGLRLEDGVDLETLEQKTGCQPASPERARRVARLVERGRLAAAPGRWWIEPREWLFADGTIAELL